MMEAEEIMGCHEFSDSIWKEYSINSREEWFLACDDVWNRFRNYFEEKILAIHPEYKKGDLFAEFLRHTYASDMKKEALEDACKYFRKLYGSYLDTNN